MVLLLQFFRHILDFLLNADQWAWRTFDRPQLQMIKLPDPPPPDPQPCPPSPMLRDESLQLEVFIYGNYPVQGDGTVLGYPLYFRARWNDWGFTVSLSPGVIVDALLHRQNTTGFFRDGEHEGFYLTEHYPQAGNMPLDDAKEILLDCARRFAHALSQSRPQGRTVD